MDSFSLLAETSSSNVRPRSLRTDDDRYALLVRLHDEADETFIQVRAYLDGLGWFHTVVSSQGDLMAMAIAGEDRDATKRLRERLAKEHGIEIATPGYHLMAEHPDGNRRRAVLHTDDDRISARAKVHFDEDGEETLLRVRLYIDDFGAVQMVLSDSGRIRAFVTGRTDSDAFERVRGELVRRGIELV